MQLHHWITELLRSCVIRMLGKFADRCGLDESSVMLRFWVCLEKEVCCWASWQYSFEESCWASQQYRFRTLSESEVCHRSPCGSEWFWQLCHQTPCGSTPCGSEWQCQPQTWERRSWPHYGCPWVVIALEDTGCSFLWTWYRATNHLISIYHY